MSNELLSVRRKEPQTVTKLMAGLPAVVEEAGDNARYAYEEFFAELDSKHRIAAHRRDLNRFLHHLKCLGFALQQTTPKVVRAYIDNLKPVNPADPPLSAPTKKRALAAIRKAGEKAIIIGRVEKGTGISRLIN